MITTYRRRSASARAPPGSWLYPDSISWGTDVGIKRNRVAILWTAFPSTDKAGLEAIREHVFEKPSRLTVRKEGTNS